MQFWDKILQTADDPRRLFIEGTSYWVGDDKVLDGTPRGFGGRKFTIIRKDGHLIETTNLWTQGEVPSEYRQILKDNAAFVEGIVYCDSAATTKPLPEVMDAMKPYFYDRWYNPSSLYMPAMQVKKDIEKVKETIAEYINAEPDEIYFTSGGCEGNSWALQGTDCKHIYISRLEHKSIINLTEHPSDCGFYYRSFFYNDKRGHVIVDPDAISNFNINTLASVQYANNEIGTIQDIKSIAGLAQSKGWLFHTDAVQAFGQIPIDVKQIGMDMMTVSGHKFGCPKGIGFLYIKRGTPIHPLIYGTQNNGIRGGTENVPYIIGLGKAVELLQKKDIKTMTTYRDKLIDALISDGFTINGAIHNRLSNNISATIPLHYHIPAETMILALANRGVFVSAGSACNSHGTEPSHVLTAIGLSKEQADSTIRISLPDNIQQKDITRIIFEIRRNIELFKS